MRLVGSTSNARSNTLRDLHTQGWMSWLASTLTLHPVEELQPPAVHVDLPRELPLRSLPVCILAPLSDVGPRLPNLLLKRRPLPALVLLQLLQVLHSLLRLGRRLLLEVGGLAEQLLGSDLDGRGRAVLDPGTFAAGPERGRGGMVGERGGVGGEAGG